MQMLAFEDFYSEDGSALTPAVAPSRAEDPLVFSALKGRLSEFSSIGTQGAGSLALRYVWQAQQEGFWPVWVSCAGLPFVEDLVASGVDTENLPLIRTLQIGESLRAAERVLRSEVCGLVVVDVGEEQNAPSAMIARLLKLAQRTESAYVLLSSRPRTGGGSLSPLVSLRLDVSYGAREGALRLLDPRYMPLEATIVRDKRAGRRDAFSVRTAVAPGLY